jgi:hypothetical protein
MHDQRVIAATATGPTALPALVATSPQPGCAPPLPNTLPVLGANTSSTCNSKEAVDAASAIGDATGEATGSQRDRTITPELAGPDDADRARRLSWSVLMKRTLGLEVLTCSRCAGPMRLVSVIENEQVARRILAHLGLPTRAPPRGRIRRPGQQRLAFHDDPARFDGIDPLPIDS